MYFKVFHRKLTFIPFFSIYIGSLTVFEDLGRFDTRKRVEAKSSVNFISVLGFQLSKDIEIMK